MRRLSCGEPKMRAFSSTPHALLMGVEDHRFVNSVNLSRVSLALLIVAVLVWGVVLGSALPAWGERVAATPSPPVAVPSPSPSDLAPAVDVPGEDLARLPRYPGSMRSEFFVSTDDRYRLTAVEFMADASLDAVRTFYQGVIVEHGWQRADIGYSGEEWTYVLVDGPIEALIEIEITGGMVEIDLQISEPIMPPTSDPTPAPAGAPPPQQPAPPPPGDDDGDDDDGGGDDSDDGGTDG